MMTAVRPAQTPDVPAEQPRAAVEETDTRFEEVLQEETEEAELAEAVEVTPEIAPVDLTELAFVQLPEGEPDGDPIAAAKTPSLELKPVGPELAQQVEEGDQEIEAEAVPVEAASFEPPLQETNAPVDSQVTLRAETKSEPPAAKVVPAPQVEAAFEPAFEEPIQMTRLTAESAELVLGQGERRVSLTVSTEGQRVHVSALTPSAEVVQALTRTSGELRDALSRQGYELGGFDTRRDRSSHEEQREPAHAERKQLVVKKKRIVA